MELPPNRGGDKGFFTEGVDASSGKKRKSTLTDIDNDKVQRITSLYHQLRTQVETQAQRKRDQYHARRAHSPEPTAKTHFADHEMNVPGPYHFWDYPGGDIKRDHNAGPYTGGLWLGAARPTSPSLVPRQRHPLDDERRYYPYRLASWLHDVTKPNVTNPNDPPPPPPNP